MLDQRQERTVARVIRSRARRLGERSWIRTGGMTYSFAEMDTMSDRLATGLAQRGVVAGDTVLLLLPDGIDIIACWLALAKLGALEVPVNTQLRGNVLRHVLADSAAKVMVVDRGYLDRLLPLIGELPELNRLILSGRDGTGRPAGVPERLVVEELESCRTEPDRADWHDPRHCDLTAVMYTSGTTGPSKGVMIAHAHCYEYALSCVELLELNESDVYYNPLPLFHIAGQWAAVYASLIAGCSVVIPGAFSLSAFWQDVRGHGGTCTFLLGAMASWLWRQPETAADIDTPMQRMLIVPLLPEVEAFKRRFGVQVSTTWGSTEINVPTRSSFELADNRTCGRVASDRYEVRIVDESDEEVPPGVPGEALVRTREPWTLMVGYWRNPEATAKALENQWVHSGDVLKRDEAGNLFFVDRVKDAIRRRGENISSMEVEAEILAHEAVLECAVVPIASPDGEQEVMAIVVPKPGRMLDPADLIAFLAPRMARFMVPRYVELLDEMPKTPTGKIQKYVLRERGLTPTTWDREQAGIKVRR